MIDNKWKHGKKHIILPRMAHVLVSLKGIKTMRFVLDKAIGPEIILLITESSNLIKDFEDANIIDFYMKSGLVKTSYGPVYWMLFYFPKLPNGEKAIYENSINPINKIQMAPYEQLANQKYWHIITADQKGEVSNFFEFKNVYDLSDTLWQVKRACSGMKVKDFMLAKAEYENIYSIEELMEMED